MNSSSFNLSKSLARLLSGQLRSGPYLLVLMIGLLATGSLWQALYQAETDQAQRATEAEAQHLKTAIEETLRIQINALERMAKRWQAQGGTSREQWEADAAEYMQHYKGIYHALEWVDADFHVRWIVPLAGNEQALGLDLGTEDRRREALTAAKDSRSIRVTRVIELVQGGRGFLVYLPLYVGDRFDGFILGVFRLDTLFAQAGGPARAQGYSIRVAEEGVEHLHLTQLNEASEDALQTSVTVNPFNINWSVTVSASDRLVTTFRTGVPTMVAVFGVMLSGLLAVVIYFSQKTARQSIELERRIHAHEEAEERILRLFESNPTALIMCDGTGVIRMVNSEAEALFACGRDDLLGRPVEDLLPEENRGVHREHVTGFFNAPAARNMGEGRDLMARRKSGVLFPVAVALKPVEMPEGLHTLAAVVDISERKAAEAEIKRSNRELEQFAYVASHDLKAPLRGIEQLVAWLTQDLGENVSEDTSRYLGLLASRTQRLQGLLDGLLEYSRIGRNRSTLVDFDTAESVANAVADLSPDPEFSVRMKGSFPNLFGERDLFERVILNLVGNAIKHHDREDGEIEVSVTAAPGGYEFSVTDDGPGIQPKYHEKIFGMFQTLRPRDEVEGSGMGLAIVKKAVEYQGGRIQILSDPDAERGTVIRFLWSKEAKA